jgi:hypothetical protein
MRKQQLLRRLSESGFQLMPAARKWFRSQIPAIAIDAVEYREALRNVTTLEELESRNSFRVERYNLTVENQGSISNSTDRSRDICKCGGPVEVISRQ